MAVVRGAGYDEARGKWLVPAQYNVAVDTLDWQRSGATAMVWTNHEGRVRYVTFGELRAMSNRVAWTLNAVGIEKGDTVGVVLPQLPETAATYAGILRVGGILGAMSVAWGPEQLAIRLELGDARALVTDRNTLEQLPDSIRREVRILLLDDGVFDRAAETPFPSRTLPDDPAHLYFTSGTSGPAKALVHAQRSLIGHNEFEYCHALTPDTVFYAGGDWAWSHAKLFGPWRYGACQLVVVPEHRFDPELVLDAMARYRVQSTLLNPTIIKQFHAAVSSRDGRRWALRTVCSSNEPLDPELSEWFAAHFGVPVREYYGLTESYPAIGYAADEEVVRGSTGRVLPGWVVALRAEDGSIVLEPDRDTIGEAVFRAHATPQYPLGYWKNDEATAAAFGGEWFRTGDLFTRRADGYWFFIGRNDDVIKTAGYRVGPAEIERILEEHPLVREAAVIGIPDRARGQVIKAVIALESQGIDADALRVELQDLVKSRYARFAYPREIEFVERLPRSSTGKVQRAELRRRHTDTTHNEARRVGSRARRSSG